MWEQRGKDTTLQRRALLKEHPPTKGTRKETLALQDPLQVLFCITHFPHIVLSDVLWTELSCYFLCITEHQSRMLLSPRTCLHLCALSKAWPEFELTFLKLTSSVLTKGWDVQFAGNIPSWFFCVFFPLPPPPKQHTKCVFPTEKEGERGVRRASITQLFSLRVWKSKEPSDRWISTLIETTLWRGEVFCQTLKSEKQLKELVAMWNSHLRGCFVPRQHYIYPKNLYPKNCVCVCVCV